MKYSGRLARIELTRIRLPPRDKECPFQAANILSIRSRRGYQPILERAIGLSGSPR